MLTRPRNALRVLDVDDDPHHAELNAALLGADPREPVAAPAGFVLSAA